MNNKIAYGGMGCALCVIMLAMSAYLPTGRAATLFIASLLSYVMCFVANKKTAFIMYAASCVLGLILLSGGSPVIIASYIICFGNYPILKTIIDFKPIAFKIIAKAILYTIYFILVCLVCRLVINVEIQYAMPLLYAAAIFVFAFYDYLILYSGRYVVSLLNK